MLETNTSHNEWLLERISDFNDKMFAFQNVLRRKHIKKLNWIFHKQLHNKKAASMPLNDVITILNDIQLPQFATEIFSKGPSCALFEACNVTNDIPVFERVIEPMNELDAEKQRWSFVNEFNRKKSHNWEPPIDSPTLK